MPALEDTEVLRMVKPLTQPAAIRKYLRSIGIRAERRPDGGVLVLSEWLTQNAAPHEPQMNL